MKVLLVCHYFPPEIGAPQARLSEMAAEWARRGADVTVLTGMPNHPTGVIPPRYRRRHRMEESTDGYRVVRTWLYATPNEGTLKKTIGHLSFMVTSVLLGLGRVGRPDVVVVSSPTFFSIFSALLIAHVRRARFVVEVRDLWPAIFVELGVLTNRRVIRLLERIELAMYRAADKVVVVTEGFRDDLVRRGVPAGKVHVIRNGVDLERFGGAVSESERRSTRAELGVDDTEVLVLYAGAHGLSHGLTTVAEAAHLVTDQPIHFVFVGEGAAKRDLEAKVTELGLHRTVTMKPGMPREQIPALLAAADICLVPLRDVQLFSSFIPSKIFEYLAAGRAVIGAVRGEAAAILRDAGAAVVDPGDPAALAEAIRELAGDPGRRSRMGENGKREVSAQHDRAKLAARYLDEVLYPRETVCAAADGQRVRRTR